MFALIYQNLHLSVIKFKAKMLWGHAETYKPLVTINNNFKQFAG